MPLKLNGHPIDPNLFSDEQQAVLEGLLAPITQSLDTITERVPADLEQRITEAAANAAKDAIEAVRSEPPADPPDEPTAITTAVETALKPFKDEIEALKSERASERSSAEMRARAKRVVDTKYSRATPERQEILERRIASANPADDAAAEAAAEAVIGEWAVATGKSAEDVVAEMAPEDPGKKTRREGEEETPEEEAQRIAGSTSRGW